MKNNSWKVSLYFIGLILGFSLGVICTLIVQQITG